MAESTHLAVLAEELGIAPARSVGRPTIYTDELAAEICEAVENGLSLYKLCPEKPHWPNRATIYRWARENAAFGEKFEHARACKAHLLVEEITDIADDAQPDMEDIRLAELQMKARQFVAPLLSRDHYAPGPAVQVNQQLNFSGAARACEAKLDQLLERMESENANRRAIERFETETPVLGSDFRRQERD